MKPSPARDILSSPWHNVSPADEAKCHIFRVDCNTMSVINNQ